MTNNIDDLLKEIKDLKAESAEELENLRLKFLSKKGILNDLMADFRNVPVEQKKEVGQKLNLLKSELQEKFSELKSALEDRKSVV